MAHAPIETFVRERHSRGIVLERAGNVCSLAVLEAEAYTALASRTDYLHAERLSLRVYGGEERCGSALPVVIYRLRRKLIDIGLRVEARPGVGYRLLPATKG